MRTLLLALALAAFASRPGAADDTKPGQPAPKLKAGDPPPPLKPTKWLAGKEVPAFEKGKVYVVEFWATWCGPCVVMMPHLGDLQDQLGPKGVTVIGFTAKDGGNTPERVAEFVKKRGDKLGYAIAYADDRDTYDAYMKASGQGGIPCSYVVGKDGTLAFIGHPLFLDDVLPKVLAGTWDPVKGAAEMKAADELWDATYAAVSKPGSDPGAQLAQWKEFADKWPKLATDPYMNAARLKLLLAAKRFADAQALAGEMVEKAGKRNDTPGLATVADAVAEGAAGQPELAALAVKAAEAGMALDGETPATLVRVLKAYAAAGDAAKVKELGPKAVAAAEKAVVGDADAFGLLQLAAAHLATGDKEKAKATAEKAVAGVDPKNVNYKKYVEDQAKKYGAGPKADEKKE